MFTDIQIINMGLSKLAQSRISRIDPPGTNLERFEAENYAQWKRSELAKRRWVFAWEFDYELAQIDYEDGRRQPYVYTLPVWALKPIRGRRDEWRQEGRTIRSCYEALKIDIVKNVAEPDFDPLFVDVLACRIAFESAEYVTQSNTKKETAYGEYREAVAEAAKANAFVIGPEPYHATDEAFPFVYGRF